MLVSAAIERAYREGAIRPIGSGTPTDDEMVEGLYRLNSLWKGIRATALGEVLHDWQLPNRMRTAPHNANNIAQPFPQNLSGFNQPGSIGWGYEDDVSSYNTSNRQHYPPVNCRILCGLSGEDHNLWLPQYPADGSRISLVDVALTDPLTVNGNGRKIEGETTLVFSPGDPSKEWLYRADLADWVDIGSDLELTDELPLPSEFDDFFVCGTAIRLCALDQLDPQPPTTAAYALAEKKIMQRYYQPGIASWGGQNAAPSYQSYNGYMGYGGNFRSGY